MKQLIFEGSIFLCKDTSVVSQDEIDVTIAENVVFENLTYEQMLKATSEYRANHPEEFQ